MASSNLLERVFRVRMLTTRSLPMLLMVILMQMQLLLCMLGQVASLDSEQCQGLWTEHLERLKTVEPAPVSEAERVRGSGGYMA